MSAAVADNGIWHVSLTLNSRLWSDLISAALPVRVAGGEFDLVDNVRVAVKRLELRKRVRGLLEDTGGGEALASVTDRAATVWRERRDQVVEIVDEILKVEGNWLVEVSREGSSFTYGVQSIALDAHVRVAAEGTAKLLSNRVEFPFSLSKRVGASATLGDIRFDRGTRSVVGSLKDLVLDLGDHAVLEALGRLAVTALDKQVANVNPVKILAQDQLDGMFGGAGEALKMKMGVEAFTIDVDQSDVTLRVRFGFEQLQLEG